MDKNTYGIVVEKDDTNHTLNLIVFILLCIVGTCCSALLMVVFYRLCRCFNNHHDLKVR